MAKVDFTTPVGRLLQGSVYEPQDKDMNGNPLTIKSGPNIGKPTVKYYFAIGIPKGQEQHWAQTPWGAIIYAAGQAAFPQICNNPNFAWKVMDGNAPTTDSKGIVQPPRDDWKNNWILRFSSSFAPKLYNKDGSAALLEPNAIRLGYYVQVFGQVDGNNTPSKPGVFLNHSMVALTAFGPEIIIGPNASAVGFGQNVTLPAGASTTPIGSFAPPGLPGASPVPFVQTPAPFANAGFPMNYAGTPATPLTTAPSATPPPSNIPPNPAFLQIPGGGAGLPPKARVMLPSAGGNTYEQMIAQGWNDALLIQHGYMAP